MLIVYSLLLTVLLYLIRKYNKLTVNISLCITIYLLSGFSLLELILPSKSCVDGSLIEIPYNFVTTIIVVLILILVLRQNYLIKKSWKYLVLAVVISLIHFVGILKIDYLNYLIFYDYLFDLFIKLIYN